MGSLRELTALRSAGMPGKRFDQMSCPIAQTLAVIGERWTPLILRDVAFGLTRFDTIQRELGISRKVLTERLAGLVEHGVLERTPYQEAPTRYDYTLTEKGADLCKVLLAMQAWGNRWMLDEPVGPTPNAIELQLARVARD
jgi:DNA-binding HxlR family transcriptional regulator